MIRKLQRLASAMLCLAMLFLMTATAFAAPTPYVLIRRCPNCMYGTVYHTESEKFDGEIQRQHGSHYDIYYEYDVEIHEYCDSCDFRYDHEYEREDLIYCPSKR